jgi:hypothetical protein
MYCALCQRRPNCLCYEPLSKQNAPATYHRSARTLLLLLLHVVLSSRHLLLQAVVWFYLSWRDPRVRSQVRPGL